VDINLPRNRVNYVANLSVLIRFGSKTYQHYLSQEEAALQLATANASHHSVFLGLQPLESFAK
jgi:hypothetical protein